MFKCQECGRKFRKVEAARRASENGCPGCGGVDIDLDPDPKPVRTIFPKPLSSLQGVGPVPTNPDPFVPADVDDPTPEGWESMTW